MKFEEMFKKATGNEPHVLRRPGRLFPGRKHHSSTGQIILQKLFITPRPFTVYTGMGREVEGGRSRFISRTNRRGR